MEAHYGWLGADQRATLQGHHLSPQVCYNPILQIYVHTYTNT